MEEFNRPTDWHPRQGPVIEVPFGVLRFLPQMETAWLRLLLCFILKEKEAGETGKPIPFTELWQGAGVAPARARLALTTMAQATLVEAVGTTAWRLTDAPTAGPSDRRE